jgi:hypothetical protein
MLKNLLIFSAALSLSASAVEALPKADINAEDVRIGLSPGAVKKAERNKKIDTARRAASGNSSGRRRASPCWANWR